MNVTTNPTITATAATNVPGAAAQHSTALDRDAFLHLLVSQLQHQDPTQPLDDGQFVAQLAQFSSLEQMQQMNRTLTMIAQALGVSP